LDVVTFALTTYKGTQLLKRKIRKGQLVFLELSNSRNKIKFAFPEMFFQLVI